MFNPKNDASFCLQLHDVMVKVSFHDKRGFD